MRQASPYQERFLRRPILYWWQTVAMFVIVALLFSRIPFASIRRQALNVVVPLPAPTAAYVALDPDHAAQLFKRSLAAWMTGQTQKPNTPGLDLSALDFGNALGAPEFLEQSAIVPGDRQPPAAAALPVALAEISVPPYAPAQKAAPPPKPQEGVFAAPSAALIAAGFTFPADALKTMKGRSGECRFYVETDAEGSVVHVLLRSPPLPETAQVERALMRGRANSAASGMVDIRWSFAK
ncbi:MAG: hypothetical protein FWG50_08060 [Kiritimatiellaeota bacterium]|nr:hypothetical protein [Kiritimatiellota bacterium]